MADVIDDGWVQFEVPDMPNGEILLRRTDDAMSGGEWARVFGGFVIVQKPEDIAELNQHDPGQTSTPKPPYCYRVPLRTDRPTRKRSPAQAPANVEG